MVAFGRWNVTLLIVLWTALVNGVNGVPAVSPVATESRYGPSRCRLLREALAELVPLRMELEHAAHVGRRIVLFGAKPGNTRRLARV